MKEKKSIRQFFFIMIVDSGVLLLKYLYNNMIGMHMASLPHGKWDLIKE
jgi:hypothetical protein